MKKIMSLFCLFLFATMAYSQQPVAFTPPPTQETKSEMADRAEMPVAELLKKEGFLEHKSFASNQSPAEYTMYVEFVTQLGRKYTIPAIFVSWKLEVEKEVTTGFIEIYKDSVFEGYPVLTYTLSEQPYFYKALKLK